MAMIDEDLEKLMSCSNWVAGKTPEEAMKSFYDVSIERTERFRNEIPSKLNIPYGAKEAQKLDLYGTNVCEEAKFLFLWIHGGYWQEGSKEFSALMVDALFERKIPVAVVGYTLCPQVRVTEIATEIVEAITFLTKEYPKLQLVVGGHSAGAHLAAESVLFSDLSTIKIAGLALISGVFDLKKLINTTINDKLGLTESEASICSPLLKMESLNHQKVAHMKMFVAVGVNESPEFHRQANLMSNSLAKLCPCEYLLAPAADHFSIVLDMSDPLSSIGKEFLTFISSI